MNWGRCKNISNPSCKRLGNGILGWNAVTILYPLVCFSFGFGSFPDHLQRGSDKHKRNLSRTMTFARWLRREASKPSKNVGNMILLLDQNFALPSCWMITNTWLFPLNKSKGCIKSCIAGRHEMGITQFQGVD